MSFQVSKILPDSCFSHGLQSSALKLIPEKLRNEEHFEFLKYINDHDDAEHVLQVFGELIVINLGLIQIRKFVDNLDLTYEILSNLSLVKNVTEMTKLDPYTKYKKQLECILKTMKVEKNLICRLYNICNDKSFLSKTYFFDATSLIPTEDQSVHNPTEHFRKPQMSFQLFKLTKERDELIELTKRRNKELHEIIHKMRRIVFDINVMLESRKNEDGCEMCIVKPMTIPLYDSRTFVPVEPRRKPRNVDWFRGTQYRNYFNFYTPDPFELLKKNL